MKQVLNSYQLFLYTVLFITQTMFSAYSIADTKKADNQCKELKRELKSRKNALITAMVHKDFERIDRLMGKKGKEEQILEKITKLEERVKNRPHSLAKAYHTKAQVYFGSEQLQKAFEYYNKAIGLKVLPYNDHLSVLYDIARVYLYQDNLNKAEEIVEQIFCLTDKVTGALYILKATILNEKKQIKPALEMTMKAIDSRTPPPQSWLIMAVGLHFQLHNYVSAAKLLTHLTARYPDKKQYWKQLSGVYQHLNKESQVTTTLDLAHKLNFLERESEILHLSGFLMQQGQPLKAAKLIEQFMEQKKVKMTKRNYEILGDCWSYANEIKQALLAYERAHQVSSNSAKKDWKLPVKIGDIYYAQESWQKSVKYFTAALAIKGVKRPEQLYIKIGIALHHLKEHQEAIQSFEKVITTKATSQFIKTAREWIDFISEKYLNQRAETTE